MMKLSDYQYLVGERLEFELTFTNYAGDIQVPNDFTVVIVAPNGTSTKLTVEDATIPTPGKYLLYQEVDQQGRWFMRIDSVGAPDVALEGYFDVAWSTFG